MAKFNLPGVRPRVTTPVRSEPLAGTRTYEGGAGHRRDPRSELFLLAVTNLVGEDTFYERAGGRDRRFAELVAHLAVTDLDWLTRMLTWLRAGANLRSAPLAGACEAVHARLAAGLHGGNRELVDAVCRRADEPGEVLAYWVCRFGRAVPKPVKRGVADAVARLYSERALLAYDGAGRGFRFGDVLELVHAAPAPDRPWQGDLFAHAIDRRHDRDRPVPERLAMLRARAELAAVPVEERRALLAEPARLAAAGMTWEALSGWLQGPMDRAAWEAVIPSMGYMARLRNLRNFDEAGVSDEVAAGVCAQLADPAAVAGSRQLPLRFYSAYRAAPSLRWGHALEAALNASLANIPALGGRTLVLVDTSGSMHAGFSRDGTLMRWDAAALFGIALAGRCASADVVSFAGGTKVFPLRPGEPVLRALERFRGGGWFLGGGTETAAALRKHVRGHDRVVVLTDEQAYFDPRGTVDAAVPERVPMYTWNLAGYRAGHAPSGSGNRHTFGGLTDTAFRLIPLLEAGRDGDWPF
jgi:hypothetical protein